MKNLDSDIKVKQAELDTLTAKVGDTKLECIAYEERTETLIGEIEEMQVKANTAVEDKDRAVQDATESKERAKVVNAQLEAAGSKLGATNAEVGALEDKGAKLQSEYDELEKKHNVVSKSYGDKMAEIKERTKLLDQKEVAVAEYEEQLDLIKAGLDKRERLLNLRLKAK